jgi:hypothetical protein
VVEEQVQLELLEQQAQAEEVMVVQGTQVVQQQAVLQTPEVVVVVTVVVEEQVQLELLEQQAQAEEVMVVQGTQVVQQQAVLQTPEVVEVVTVVVEEAQVEAGAQVS